MKSFFVDIPTPKEDDDIKYSHDWDWTLGKGNYRADGEDDEPSQFTNSDIMESGLIRRQRL